MVTPEIFSTTEFEIKHTCQTKHNKNYEFLYSRLRKFNFPSTLTLWNEIDLDTCNSSSLLEFKIELTGYR